MLSRTSANWRLQQSRTMSGDLFFSRQSWLGVASKNKNWYRKCVREGLWCSNCINKKYKSRLTCKKIRHDRYTDDPLTLYQEVDEHLTVSKPLRTVSANPLLGPKWGREVHLKDFGSRFANQKLFGKRHPVHVGRLFPIYKVFGNRGTEVFWRRFPNWMFLETSVQYVLDTGFRKFCNL